MVPSKLACSSLWRIFTVSEGSEDWKTRIQPSGKLDSTMEKEVISKQAVVIIHESALVMANKPVNIFCLTYTFCGERFGTLCEMGLSRSGLQRVLALVCGGRKTVVASPVNSTGY